MKEVRNFAIQIWHDLATELQQRIWITLSVVESYRWDHVHGKMLNLINY